ncbi:MAG: cytochrome C [Candidatus Accumulibacter sp. 66-26]|nr:MAG: cytochrome C [Candidatus Accumulibacter sp. 66-26]
MKSSARRLAGFSLSALLPMAVLSAAALAPRPAHAESDARLIERGRYVVALAGCNDCHTPGYAQYEGKVPEAERLTGDRLGWRGPWGTTYPANLRRYFAGVSEREWLAAAANASYRPPMPLATLRHMSERDLRAVYRYVRSLGPAGEAAPAYLPPGSDPLGPVVMFPAPPN